jgi:FMN reductase
MTRDEPGSAPPRLAIVIGQATRPGRLSHAAEALAGEIRRLRSDAGVDLIDLSATQLEICDGRRLEDYGAATRAAVETIERASAVALCSPVYRASFPGVLKNALDLLPVEALRDKPVGIVAMGASDHHYLGVDGHLRSVLAWFGALPLPTSLYLTGADFPDGRELSPQARESVGAIALSLLDLARRVSGASFGPPPLAARRRS